MSLIRQKTKRARKLTGPAGLNALAKIFALIPAYKDDIPCNDGLGARLINHLRGALADLNHKVNRQHASKKPELPGWKISNIKKSRKDGQLHRFALKDEQGEVSYCRDVGERWIKTDRLGIESIVDGSFRLSDDNELIYRKSSGCFQIHHTDGRITNGRELPDGSTVYFDDCSKKAVAIYRKDGSKIEFEKDNYNQVIKNQVIETKFDGLHRTVWTRNNEGVWTGKNESKDQEGNWLDNSTVSCKRTNIELTVNGRYTYEDDLSFRHVIKGDGCERIEPRVAIGKNGTKIIEVQYPNGKDFRTLVLDKFNRLVKFTERDRDGIRTYVQSSGGKWQVKAGLRMVELSTEFQLLKNGDFLARDGNETEIQKLDGSVIHETIVQNGNTFPCAGMRFVPGK